MSMYGYLEREVLCGTGEKEVLLVVKVDGATVQLDMVTERWQKDGKPFFKQVEGEMQLVQRRKRVEVTRTIPMKARQAEELGQGLTEAAEYAEEAVISAGE